jgi:hypothetical protein
MTALPARRTRLLPIVLAQGVGLGCGVAGVKVVSHFVPPGPLGAYGLFLTFASLGVSVVHAGLIKFVGRHWAAASHAGLRHEVREAWLRKLPWLALASAAGAGALGAMTGENVLAIFPPLFAAAALLSLTALAQAALQAVRSHWRDFAVSAAASVLRTFAPPAAFVLLGAPGLAWGFCLYAALTAAVAAWETREPSPGTTPAGAGRQLTPIYEGPLFTMLAVAGWALVGVNRWIVAWRFGATTAGYFTLAGNAALILPAVFATIFLQYFQPGFFAEGDSLAPEARARLARRVDAVAATYAAVALLALAALVAVSPHLVGPLISENYRAALVWLLPAGCFGLATGTGLFYHSLLLAGRRERACGPVDLTAAGVLVAGGVVAAILGEGPFRDWLIATPLIPWLVNRPLARRHFFMPAADPGPAPAPGKTSGP